MNKVVLRVKRVKFLFEHGQITNVDAIRLLEQRIHNLPLSNYAFMHTVLGHGERN